MNTRKVARPKAGLAAQEGHAMSNEVEQKGATRAKKTGTQRTAQDAAGGWSVGDGIVDEPPAARIERIRAARSRASSSVPRRRSE